MSKLRLSPAVFLVAFCCAYVVVFSMNWPLFRYYPFHGEFAWGPGDLPGAGPVMSWYGLLCSAAAVAIVPALVVPDRAVPSIFRGYLWLFPLAAMGACGFLLRTFFV